MTTEYINYYVWPDGTWVSEENYVASDYLDKSDDWFLLPLPIDIDYVEVHKAVLQALQGFYPYAQF